MNTEDRIAQLEQHVRDLAGALARQGSIKDGNWGYPDSMSEFQRIHEALDAASLSPQTKEK